MHVTICLIYQFYLKKMGRVFNCKMNYTTIVYLLSQNFYNLNYSHSITLFLYKYIVLPYFIILYKNLFIYFINIFLTLL
jgi:hypothetical protein